MGVSCQGTWASRNEKGRENGSEDIKDSGSDLKQSNAVVFGFRPLNPFTPKLKKYILPTFSNRNV